MEKTLKILNDLEHKGIINRYAIGGAMAATFYAEPVATFDLDIFVVLPESPGGLTILTPIYDKLQKHGYAIENEYVIIEGTPVQFLPAYNDLVEEALYERQDIDYNDTKTHVFRVEYLIAIAVQTGREKDKDRVHRLMQDTSIDLELLKDILSRFSLLEKWKKWNN